jgi:hypothetical protein
VLAGMFHFVHERQNARGSARKRNAVKTFESLYEVKPGVQDRQRARYRGLLDRSPSIRRTSTSESRAGSWTLKVAGIFSRAYLTVSSSATSLGISSSYLKDRLDARTKLQAAAFSSIRCRLAGVLIECLRGHIDGNREQCDPKAA